MLTGHNARRTYRSGNMNGKCGYFYTAGRWEVFDNCYDC